MLFPNQWLNLASIIWFFSLWLGYARIAHYQARRINCLASSMHGLRVSWMTQLLSRENRVADSSIIANIERNVAFMASTSILVLAGIVTALASTEDLYALLSGLHVAGVNSYEEIQLKLGALALIFIYAFFTFTWSLRQFGFCSVIVGAAPDLEDFSGDVDTDAFIKHGAKVLDQAAHSFNFGLRAFYYAVATLAWFIHPIAFMASVTVVVWVLYHREFRSTTMRALISVNKDLEALGTDSAR
jgi:uncharacterized membrane protein